jgi:hypothetical protein
MVRLIPKEVLMALRSFLLLFLLGCCSNAFAGRSQVMLADVREYNATVVTATLHNPQAFEEPNEQEPKHPNRAFKFKLKIVDVVRRGKLAAEVREIDVPFSSRTYGGNWEFEDAPQDGMEVIAYFAPDKEGRLTLFQNVGGIQRLPPRESVEAIRLIDKIWEIKDPQERLKATQQGAESDNAYFRVICLAALARPDWNQVGIDLKEVLTPQEAQQRQWEYFLDPNAKWEAVSQANHFFSNQYRGVGWETHEPRYAVLVRITLQAAREQQPIHHNLFDAMAIGFCRFPNHARESHDHLLEILAGPPATYKLGIASRFSLLYQPFATHAETQKTNRQIVATLNKLLTDNDDSVAEGAAWAVSHIARSCAQLGPIPEDIQRLIAEQADIKINKHAAPTLRMARLDCKKMPQQELPKDARVLAYPWSDAIGQRVVALAFSNFKDSKLGPSVSVGEGARLWVPELPPELNNGKDLRLTGKLVREFDLPRFVYEKGGAWGQGLPVLKEADLETSRERFLLTEATFEELKRP